MNILKLIPALLITAVSIAPNAADAALRDAAAEHISTGRVSVSSQSMGVSLLDEIHIGEIPLMTPEGIMELDEYVFGVLLGELPYTFDADTFAAQAVAARSYCLYCSDRGMAIQCAYDTPEALAEDYGDEYARASVEAARRAVGSTADIIAVYDGEPISALWHSSSYGWTESSVNVWGGGFDYLVQVPTYENGDFLWSSAEFDLYEVYNRLYEAGYYYNMEENLILTRVSGRCDSLTIGSVTLTGVEARTIFGLKSTDFSARFESGRLIFEVAGYGHGVGMSQYGAEWFARAGWDWQSILLHYYPGCEIIAW